jgi:cyclase
MIKVTERVFYDYDYRGCNPSYIVTPAGTVAVDTPQLASKVVEMRSEMEKKGKVLCLINTEHHIDHIFGNYWFRDVPIIAQEKIMDCFASPPPEDFYAYSADVCSRQDPCGTKYLPSREEYFPARPTVTYKDSMTIYPGGMEIQIINTPGHTLAQSAVFIPSERTVIVGDTIFSDKQIWMHSCDIQGWLQTLELLRSLDVDYIVPGHGKVVTKEYIDKQKAFMLEWVFAVQNGIAKGWSRQECLERISFSDRCPVDVGQEDSMQMVQEININSLYNYLKNESEKIVLK